MIPDMHNGCRNGDAGRFPLLANSSIYDLTHFVRQFFGVGCPGVFLRILGVLCGC